MTHGGIEERFLDLVDVSIAFGKSAIVKHLNLAIRRGEFVSILGPSGCGKTTLLRSIAGFIRCDGQIRLAGGRIDTLPSNRRGAAMVFQNYALFPHLSVFDNVGFGLRHHKVPKPEIETRVREVLATVQLQGFEQRYPRELSGGQQQRVALARAVVLNPKLLLLDEPLSNLDAKLRKDLRKDFLRIHEAAGITSLFVTHDLEEAFSISDRIAVMNHGRIEQFGTPAEIFNRPQTGFVADFVGHSNILAGKAHRDEGGAYLALSPKMSVRLPTPLEGPDDVRFAIPGHLLEISSAPVARDNCFPGRLRKLSYLGPALSYVIDFDGLEISGEIPASRENMKLAAGESVYAGWNASDMIALPGAPS